MVTVHEKLLTTMRLQGSCPTHARTEVRAGDHELVIDEPKSRGGTDLAPSPLETLIASLIGCTNVILNKIARRDGVAVDSLRVEAEAVLDRRGVTLQEEVLVPFPTIKLAITFSSDAEDAKIERLKSDLGRFCPVSKILRQSGSKIQEAWNVSRR